MLLLSEVQAFYNDCCCAADLARSVSTVHTTGWLTIQQITWSRLRGAVPSPIGHPTK